MGRLQTEKELDKSIQREKNKSRSSSKDTEKKKDDKYESTLGVGIVMKDPKKEEREADELRKTEERIKQLETSISELDYELEKIELEKSRLKPRIVEDKNISSGL